MTNNINEPLFQGTNMTNSVNLILTTLCTMECPECHTLIPKLKEEKRAKHADPYDIIRDSVHMRPMRRVHLTGGEPTLHPLFAYIVKNAKKWFKAELLTIETNGAGYKKYRKEFQRFDKVFITQYRLGAMYKNSPDNTEIIKQAYLDLGDKLITEAPVVHLPLVLKANGNQNTACGKWHHPGLPCAWFDGLLYPCCVTPGNTNYTGGIRVTHDWRERLKTVSMRCDLCPFQGT